MKTLLFGFGNVGIGVGTCLLKAGQPIDILTRRPEAADLINREGFGRTGIFGDAHFPPGSFHCYHRVDQLQDRHYDAVLLMTKSVHNRQVLSTLEQNPHLFGDSGILVIFQNGWGSGQVFLKLLGPKRIYNARVITGFTRRADNLVEITVHAQPIHIGNIFTKETAAVRELCTLINTGGIPCAPASEVARDIWAKVLYNCALNPLGAILGVQYGKLPEQESSRLIMERVINEVFAVMRAERFETHWPTPEEYLKVFYAQLVPATAAHRSSMLQDITQGRKTEIDALSGAIVRLAAKHHLRAPVNETLASMVRFLENHKPQNTYATKTAT